MVNLFYPDWHSYGTNHGCKQDGEHPDYMDANPEFYLFSTLDKCCSAHYNWNYKTCMDMIDEECVTKLWYPDWHGNNVECLRDGEEPGTSYK